MFFFAQSPLIRLKTALLTTKTAPSNGATLRIRRGYTSYNAYIERQLNKTLNPKLRKIWTTRDWDRKIKVFAHFFQSLKKRNLVFNESKALSIGARVGQEVAAMKMVGVSDPGIRLRVLQRLRSRAVPVEVRRGDRADVEARRSLCSTRGGDAASR
ncbi:hypothetical protein V6N13_036005 [Hibiscus sabdariffa]|uniref:Uncharacterized protein n=1 Tax=Hibiscus sabdariffa TaxID=183260 RepID=A0ABR2S7Q5_9ROSI